MATLVEGMRQTNQTCRALDRTLTTWRTEAEMPAKDKYWVFSKKDRESGYRKGAHKVPKWTKYVALPCFQFLTFQGHRQERCLLDFRRFYIWYIVYYVNSMQVTDTFLELQDPIHASYIADIQL
jgi:hypothetical protein